LQQQKGSGSNDGRLNSFRTQIRFDYAPEQPLRVPWEQKRWMVRHTCNKCDANNNNNGPHLKRQQRAEA